ncbi:MAG: sigma-70 factor domain-containing protein, partial [Phycisphaeraceae bacterium]
MQRTQPAVAELIECGQHHGCVTFDQLIALLPDEMVEPDKIDHLLVSFARMGFGVVDERRAPAELRRRPRKKQEGRGGGKSEPDTGLADVVAAEESGDPALLDDEQAKAEFVQALQDVTSKRIDDPVRMYLTQMGEISLLTRDEEIRLAKKIETTRMIFRREVLANDYSIKNMVEILEMVDEGDLPFDRTMKISTAEENAKGKIAARIPVNVKTVKRLLEVNRHAWDRIEELEQDGTKKAEAEIEQIREAIKARRRKMAMLIEELS